MDDPAELEELTRLEQQAAALAAQGDREAEIARQIFRELIERHEQR